MRRVLVISYAFPPTGGAGVQRVTKFVKYLPRHGWEASVLTVANPSVPVTDASLAADVPAATEVCRARTWEPGYAIKSAVAETGSRGRVRGAIKQAIRRVGLTLLQPDPQVLWLPEALREGNRLLRRLRHDAVLVSGPPFSAFLTGTRLARRHGLPLVLDYRDEWTISDTYLENRRAGRVARFASAALERRVLRAAQVVFTTTPASTAALQRARDRAGSRAYVQTLYNGFDPADFPPAARARAASDGPVRVVHVGTLWNLTSAAPLVAAAKKLADCDPAAAARVHLTFVGRRTEPQDQVLDRLRALPCGLTVKEYVDHREVPALLQSADVLCALLSDVRGAERVVPAKAFEYMAARRPVLAIAPRGELWDLLDRHPAGHRFEPSDVAGIMGFLGGLPQRAAEGRLGPLADWDISMYDRSHQAGGLARTLDRLADAAAARARAALPRESCGGPHLAPA